MTSEDNSTPTHEKITQLLATVREDPSHRNYWSVHKQVKKLEEALTEDPADDPRHVRIALLSSFTVDLLVPYLDVDARLEGLLPQIYVAPFNQYPQEVLDEKSGLYRSKPDVVFFFLQVEALLGQEFRVRYPRLSLEDKQSALEEVVGRLGQLVQQLASKTQSLVVLSNFVVPAWSPYGILDAKQELGYKQFYRLLNDQLVGLAKDKAQLFILDLDSVAARHGKDNYVSYPNYYRGSLLFAESFLPYVSHEAMAYVKALKNKNRKALVLDLDNTLWGGIIGEDGLDGIKLNVNYPGSEFVDFQRTILSLYNRGIILALNSKNNLDDALEVFQSHPAMQIKEEHLGAYRINWVDKVQNLVELAKDLNIGLDSLVFLDDNPVERERVRTSLPEVLVVELPKSPALYRKTLEGLNDFDVLSLTEEDLTRGEMYYARRKRQDLESHVQSMDDFIKSLELVVEIRQADEFALPRVTSLINRTNQFNLTTRRYTEVEVRRMHEDPNQVKLYTLRVKDKFGDEGIVGVAIVRTAEQTHWVVDGFMMSCRVIGRKIETAFLNKLMRDAQAAGAHSLVGDYIPTKKNKLVEHFYPDHGFTLVESVEEGRMTWETELQGKELRYPDYLTIVEES